MVYRRRRYNSRKRRYSRFSRKPRYSRRRIFNKRRKIYRKLVTPETERRSYPIAPLGNITSGGVYYRAAELTPSSLGKSGFIGKQVFLKGVRIRFNIIPAAYNQAITTFTDITNRVRVIVTKEYCTFATVTNPILGLDELINWHDKFPYPVKCLMDKHYQPMVTGMVTSSLGADYPVSKIIKIDKYIPLNTFISNRSNDNLTSSTYPCFRIYLVSDSSIPEHPLHSDISSLLYYKDN